MTSDASPAPGEGKELPELLEGTERVTPEDTLPELPEGTVRLSKLILTVKTNEKHSPVVPNASVYVVTRDRSPVQRYTDEKGIALFEAIDLSDCEFYVKVPGNSFSFNHNNCSLGPDVVHEHTLQVDLLPELPEGTERVTPEDTLPELPEGAELVIPGKQGTSGDGESKKKEKKPREPAKFVIRLGGGRKYEVDPESPATTPRDLAPLTFTLGQLEKQIQISNDGGGRVKWGVKFTFPDLISVSPKNRGVLNPHTEQNLVVKINEPGLEQWRISHPGESVAVATIGIHTIGRKTSRVRFLAPVQIQVR